MKKIIQAIGKKEFGEFPLEISRKTVGICNEVYELTYPSESYILRMNTEKQWMYGTHKHLPIFKKLEIKTPNILAENYAKTEFPYCYQVLTKLAGKDLGVVIHELSPSNLKGIAHDISDILDKFNSFPVGHDIWEPTGLNETPYDNPFLAYQKQRKDIDARNKTSQVLEKEILDIHSELLLVFKSYFLQVKPTIFYDDMNAKNVMIHEGQFTGLVDLDFLSKGDYLSAIGMMLACWHGERFGDIYINEIIRLQKLDDFQQKVIKAYAILNIISWTSEAGVKFNANSTGKINWERVKVNKKRIRSLYTSIKD